MDGRPFAPLRIALEPGYDGGRIGVWLVDIPGGFGWAATRGRALSQTASIAGRIREWLTDHGQPLDLPRFKGVEIVDEVAPSLHDGYERNATFAFDHRALGAPELDVAVRRLAAARADLLSLIERVARVRGGERAAADRGRPGRADHR